MELALREVQVTIERVALGFAADLLGGLDARVHELELGGGPQRLLEDLRRIVQARQCLRGRIAAAARSTARRMAGSRKTRRKVMCGAHASRFA